MIAKNTVLATLFIIFFTLFDLEAQTKQNVPPEPRPPVAQKSSAPKENCEQYYENAQQYLARAEKQSEWRDANVSTAYSLLYQNCIARNKR